MKFTYQCACGYKWSTRTLCPKCGDWPVSVEITQTMSYSELDEFLERYRQEDISAVMEVEK